MFFLIIYHTFFFSGTVMRYFILAFKVACRIFVKLIHDFHRIVSISSQLNQDKFPQPDLRRLSPGTPGVPSKPRGPGGPGCPAGHWHWSAADAAAMVPFRESL